MSETKQPENSTSQKGRSVTVQITGPGIARVNPKELIQSDKVKQILDEMDKLDKLTEEKREPSSRAEGVTES